MTIRYSIYLLLLISIFIGGMVSFKKLTIPFKLLTVLIGITFISELTQKVIGTIFRNSMPVQHVYIIFEYTFFSLIYYNLFENAVLKKAILYSIGGMAFLTILNALFYQKLSQFPSVAINTSQTIYLLYSLLYFRQMLFYPAEISLFKQSVFWLNLNVLFFASSMFLNFGLTAYFLKHNLNASTLFNFSFIINMLYYSLIGFSILIDNKKIRTNEI